MKYFFHAHSFFASFFYVDSLNSMQKNKEQA